MKKSHAYRLIDSSHIKDVLSPMGDIQPINERQARPYITSDFKNRGEKWICN